MPAVIQNNKENKIRPRIVKVSKTKRRKCIPLKTVIKTQLARPNSLIITSKNQLSERENQQQHPVNQESNRTYFYHALNSNHIIVLLEDPIFIRGTLKLKLVAGSITIYDYTPDIGEELEIFSPRGTSLVKIEPKKLIGKATCLKDKLEKLSSYFNQTDLSHLLRKFDKSNGTILLLERNNCNKVLSNFKKYMTENIFPNNKPNGKESNLIPNCELLYHTNPDIAKYSKLIVDKNWNSINLQKDSKVLVIGGKSVGKSTFVRCLINRNIKQFKQLLLIDLDIGQPELFVSQTVTATMVNAPILGPGFLLNRWPNKSYIVSSINIVLIPFAYIKAVRKLIAYCKETFPEIPWIINTMGYNKGFGSELIVSLIEISTPTDVVQLQSDSNSNNFEYKMDLKTIENFPKNIYENTIDAIVPEYRFHLFNSFDKQFPNEWKLSAKDMRYAMTINRLGAILQDTDDYLTNVKPICASIDELKLVNFLDNRVSTNEQLKAINANMVYLCKVDQDDDIYECFGIGIVRAIDYQLKQIYIIPSIPKSSLINVNCLVHSEMPLPTSILINQGPKIKGTVPYVYNAIDDSRSKFVKNNSSN